MIRLVRKKEGGGGGKGKGYWYWANLFSLASLSSFLISINLFLVNLWTLRKHAEKRFSPLGRCLNSTWEHSGQIPEEQTENSKKIDFPLSQISDKAGKKLFTNFHFHFHFEKLILETFLKLRSISFQNYTSNKIYRASLKNFFFLFIKLKLEKKKEEKDRGRFISYTIIIFLGHLAASVRVCISVCMRVRVSVCNLCVYVYVCVCVGVYTQ